MTTNRVVYQNWIAELGFDPAQIKKLFDTLLVEPMPDDEIDSEVRRAIISLEEEEMEFVIRFYFMGQAYSEISEKSGREVYKLEALHKRAIRKLKSRLKSLVKKKYGIKSKKTESCPLCDSPDRKAINEIIFDKDERATWRPVMKEINRRFGLEVISPQVLIGHRKYHS